MFQYDEVYDEIDTKRKEAKLAKKSSEARAPKYIGKLLETAEKRKKDQERRIERQVQKEREAEGEEFKDKEAFVTSSYRKKLEEMKEAEDAEKREAYLENIGDVTKQQDLSGFYRHLYSQKLGDEKKTPETSDIPPPASSVTQEKSKTETSSKKKNYRKRKTSADRDDDDKSDNDDTDAAKKSTKAHLVSNLDADSDFSIDSSSSGSDSESDKEDTNEIKKPVETIDKPDLNGSNGQANDEPKKLDEEPPEPKIKIDIWKKRTVDTVFDEAVQRYYQRKAEREQAA